MGANAMPNQPHILIVEDRRELRELLVSCFSLDGTAVSEAEDGDLALSRILESPTPDSVISDVRMPRRSGLDLLREVRKSDCHVPFILITGFGTTVDEAEVLALGNASLLEKPFDFDELQAHVRRALDRHANPVDLQKERTLAP